MCRPLRHVYNLKCRCYIGVEAWLCCLCVVCQWKVSSPHGNSNHYGDHVESGTFAFTATESGDYTACFWIPDSRMAPSIVTVEFEWRSGVAAKDWSKVAKKGQVEVSIVVLFVSWLCIRTMTVGNLLSLLHFSSVCDVLYCKWLCSQSDMRMDIDDVVSRREACSQWIFFKSRSH